jgi:uncharacterized protein YdeI (YjbR/CyaY-like superfamily)
MITEIDDYFSKGCGRCARFATPDCSARKWAAGLDDLRRICRAENLTEQVKWGHPCYTWGTRNIALIGAFRSDFRINFMHAALLKDPAGILEKRGPNTRHADMVRFSDNAAVRAHAATLTAYLREAIGYAEKGIRPDKSPADVDLPGELVIALGDDPELSGAFHGLTPGRKRSYVVLLSGAKTSATRIARITKFRDRILSGKGANER